MKKTRLRYGWKLKHGITTIMENVMPYNGSYEDVTVPHDAMIGRQRSADAVSGAGEGYFEHENFEYSYKFFVPEEERALVHYVNFDGMYLNATVIVNGFYVKRHTNGYSPFTVKIDDNLRFGRENELRVQFKDQAAPFARWYAGNGIYRDVNLLTAQPMHIVDDGIHISTVSCGDGPAVINVETKIINEDRLGREAYCNITIRGKDGSVQAARRARFYLGGGGEVTVRQRVDIENALLWDADNPNLYTCDCTLTDKADGKEIDSDTAAFGIRKLQLDGTYGLRVNGRPVKLKGGALHHDNGVLGAVSVYDIEARRIRKLKEAGYNAVRTAHNIPSRALLDACDAVGMYVMEEFADCWTEAKAIFDYANFMPDTWEQDVEDAVKRDFNHPSVVMWSIGNEIPELGDPVAVQWGRKIADKFRQLDPDRFVTNGVNVMVACMPNIDSLLTQIAEEQGIEMPAGGVNDLMNDIPGMMLLFSSSPVTSELTEEACDMLDVVGYNYSADRYEKEHALYPFRLFLGSETAPKDLDVNWGLVKKNPYVLGDFCWTAWDYLGETGVGRTVLTEDYKSFMADYPWIASYCAEFDITGYRRPISYWREIVWGDGSHKPYIAVQSPKRYGRDLFVGNYNWTDSFRSWTWPGYEGEKTAVEVYSDAEEAELFVNGVSMGRKPVGDEFKPYYCKWEVEYEPGEIRVETYTGGADAGFDVLKTAGEAVLEVTADKTVLRAGSEDLCVIEIELRDAAGTLDMFSEKSVEISTEGPVILCGSGSADPATTENYLDNRHRIFEGRMMAVVGAGTEAGRARVTVRSGEEEHTVEVEVVQF